MAGSYVLQYGNLAGWPHAIARGLRAKGIDSVNAVAVDDDAYDLDRNLPYDRAIYDARGPKYRYYRKFLFLAGLMARCGLVHYHGNTIIDLLRHDRFEGRALSLARVPMIFSFGGGDARIVGLARRNNPYFYRQPDEERDERIRRWLASISRHVRFAATDLWGDGAEPSTYVHVDLYDEYLDPVAP